MKIIKITLLSIAIATLTSCASGYRMIEPTSINYLSTNETDNVVLQYKYDLLDKKYAKKELKKGVKLIAVKIANNSEKDIIFGKDAKLTYENGTEVYVLENQKAFKTLKQSPASYLWYLLLSPANLYTTKTSSNGIQQETSSTPVGLVLGPGLAGGNMIAAGSANKRFEEELLKYNVNGSIIKKGETKYGLIAIETDSFEALELKIE
ncbi:hypothetical protein [Nonlabens sp.]|uniref:hypothetical protein n=1 Tax=Nonlabens sp. TaxID=1888209 RepID=UPI003F69A042